MTQRNTDVKQLQRDSHIATTMFGFLDKRPKQSENNCLQNFLENNHNFKFPSVSQ